MNPESIGLSEVDVSVIQQAVVILLIFSLCMFIVWFSYGGRDDLKKWFKQFMGKTN